MISHFFIDRPIFAAVVSIVSTLIGAIALTTLPIAQYPRITPPGVQISISYPGASAQVVADTVAAPIEQMVNGIEGMLYMSAQMGNDGSYSLTVTFDVGTDLNTALVMVQNRVALAMPQLPSQVQNQGITIRKKTPDILLMVNFISPHNRYDDLYLSNFATIYVRDELLRVDGVADVNYIGERDYSIRAWLDPQQLAARNMTAVDVANAIRGQNLDAPVGQIGQPPARATQAFQMPVDTLGRLSEPEQFGDIIVKAVPATTLAAAKRVAPPRATAVATPQLPTLTLPNSLAASGSSTASSSTTSSTTSGSSSSASGTTSAPATSGLSTLVSGTTGGAMTGGGGTATGGGTTGGGSNSLGGATTGGAAGGAVLSAGDTTSLDAQIAAAAISPAPGAALPRPSARIVRLRDVAHVEMGAQNYNMSCMFDGQPSVGLSVYQLPTANALDTADRVRAKMEELKLRFPEGVDYTIAYDITPYIRESVSDVFATLLLAVLLVGLVVMVFLQDWRMVVIPLIAVPVAIVSTFAVMALVGFSLNNISLFGLVLAIGIVVDDAIVVVENVDRWLDHGLPPREAARRAMDEVTGPIVAVALVLCAVFVPCACISGILGQFFKQFALTIAASTVFSAINSLTLSPALAAILLKPRDAPRDLVTRLLNGCCGWFYRLFNSVFGASTHGYAWVVGWMMRLSVITLLGYVGLGYLTYFVFQRAPTGFIPQQDQGRLIVSVQLPDSASLQRTDAIMHDVVRIALATKGVAHCVAFSGLSFVLQANSTNFGSMFIVLDPFDQRHSPELRDTAIMARLGREWARQIKDAKVTVNGSSPVPGLGTAGGFKLVVEDQGGLGLAALQKQTEGLVAKISQHKGLSNVVSQFRSNTPQLFLDIDRTKAAALGLTFDDVNQTLEMYLGSLYVNSFNAFGRHWQVTVQADGSYRNEIADINLFQVRNNRGQMVPLGTLLTAREVGGPVSVTRYNLRTAATISGNIQTGYSSGEAIQSISDTAAKSLPLTMKTEWTELMFLQIRAGNTAMYVFALSVVCVFLALAALYESWSLPLAVILVVPLCLLSSTAGVLLSHRDVNIFVQIGLIVLVGLACKNAILIVEFAHQLHEQGQTVFAAAKEASRLRLRPILMTSFAFIFGVVPLVLAAGAGAEMRRSLGTAVFSGMLGVTLFGIFFTPVFFYVIQGTGETRLLQSPTVRRFGSYAAGGLLGLAIGYLLGSLHVVKPLWAMIVGASLGVVLMMVLVEIRQRLDQERNRNNQP